MSRADATVCANGGAVIDRVRWPVWLGLLLGAGLLAGGAFLVLRGPLGGDGGVAFRGGPDGGPDGEQQFEVGQEATVRGVVVENTIDPCLFPEATPCVEGTGSALRLEAGRRRVSVWYAFGMGEPCPNSAATEQGRDTRVGTTVEVRGEVQFVGDRVSITTCTSEDYHITQLE